MGIFDWLKKWGKKGSRSAENQPAGPASEQPGVPGYRRKVIRDERLRPKPPLKRPWDKRPPVMSHDEASRSFSTGFRTVNRELRSLGADVELLSARGLPPWQTEADIAKALDITSQQLRWLATHRFDDRVSHYVQFAVPKRTGGQRVIMAPKRFLKSAQRELLTKVASKLPVNDHAHGFRPGRSVRSNAEPHVGKKVVMKFDLEDFFGSVTFARVRGYLLAVGYSFEVATSLALLMTEAKRQAVEIDGELFWAPVGHRTCPQGAPTSPAMCNAIAGKLDARLAGLARSLDWTYTRYADDLTFSGDDDSKIALLLRTVSEIVSAEGFRLNAAKTRVMRQGRSQKVTGVTVNDELGLSRKERRVMRATIHRLKGLRAAGTPDDEAEERLQGKLTYLAMLNPSQATPLLRDWNGQ